MILEAVIPSGATWAGGEREVVGPAERAQPINERIQPPIQNIPTPMPPRITNPSTSSPVDLAAAAGATGLALFALRHLWHVVKPPCKLRSGRCLPQVSQCRLVDGCGAEAACGWLVGVEGTGCGGTGGGKDPCSGDCRKTSPRTLLARTKSAPSLRTRSSGPSSPRCARATSSVAPHGPYSFPFFV